MQQQTQRRDTWHSAGGANDTADYQPPSMHVGDDGARMETHVALVNGHEAVQITMHVDALTHREREKIKALMRELSSDLT